MVQFYFGRLMQKHWGASLNFKDIFSKRFHQHLCANDFITVDENELRSHYKKFDDLIIPIKDLTDEEFKIVIDVIGFASWSSNWLKPIITVNFKKFDIYPCWDNMNQIDIMFYELEYNDVIKQVEFQYGKKKYNPDKTFSAESKDEALTKIKELFDEGNYIYFRNNEVRLWVREEN